MTIDIGCYQPTKRTKKYYPTRLRPREGDFAVREYLTTQNEWSESSEDLQYFIDWTDANTRRISWWTKK